MSAEVAAPAAIVWAVISDPTRTAEWSHECNGVQFLDGVTDALREDMRRVGALAERYHHSQSPA